jgi:hypothetical protein
MGFTNIDAPGNAFNRRGVRAIQKAHGASDRKAAAKARREARAARRASCHSGELAPDAVTLAEPTHSVESVTADFSAKA